MCTFLNTLPKRSKSAGTAKRKSILCSIKPCPKDENGNKTWYKFRLLNFASKTTDRDYPFIERFIHQRWKTNDKGFPEIEDEVVCPVTKWMDWEGNRYDGCPICKYANQQFLALKESNWTDADARKKNKEFGRKYQAIVPVYVVNDPNYEGNNGKFKVIMFGDKKVYDAFVKKVETQLLKCNCFNGVNAVNCCIHMSEVPEIRNEGQPNQYEYKNKVIDQITFTKEPTNIAAITKEAVDQQLPFDETYYVSSTKDELRAFYNKYIKVSNDDVIDDAESEVKVFEAPKQDVVKKTNNVEKSMLENDTIEDDDSISENDIDDLTEENALTADENDASNVGQSANVDASDDEIADLVSGLNLD